MASISGAVGSSKTLDWDRSTEEWEKRYAIVNPIQDLLAHKEEVVKGVGFCGRQVAWSGDGAWCVVVGSMGVWAVLQRWGK
jgi:polycomb protein EED